MAGCVLTTTTTTAIRTTGRSVHEVSVFLNLIADIGGGISSKSVTVRTQIDSLPMHYFMQDNKPPLVMTEESLAEQIVLSEVDCQVLFALSRMRDFSYSAAAKMIGMPVSTFQYNVGRLQKIGIIRGFSYKFDYAGIGLSTYKITLSTRGIRPDFEKDLRKFIFSQRMTSVFIRCLGSGDFEITAVAQNSLEIFEYTQQINDRFGILIQRLEVMNCCKDYKCTDFPFELA